MLINELFGFKKRAKFGPSRELKRATAEKELRAAYVKHEINRKSLEQAGLKQKNRFPDSF